MPDRPARIVRAQPPKRRTLPLRPLAEVKRELVPPADRTDPLTSETAIQAFLGLIAAWRMPSARAWRMLTGLGHRAGALSAEQVARVDALLAIDAAMQGIALGSVGEWMVQSNAAPLFGGSAPVDYLTRLGGPGYAAVLRQVLRWQAM